MPIALEVNTALTTLGEVFNQFMTWIGSLVTTISSQPLLLLTTSIFVAGSVIGLAYRLIRS